MANDSQPKKGGKNLTTSPARKARYGYYATNHLREKHKIKRALKSCGFEFADNYARSVGMTGYLASLVRASS